LIAAGVPGGGITGIENVNSARRRRYCRLDKQVPRRLDGDCVMAAPFWMIGTSLRRQSHLGGNYGFLSAAD
jgi:hypothetical protein